MAQSDTIKTETKPETAEVVQMPVPPKRPALLPDRFHAAGFRFNDFHVVIPNDCAKEQLFEPDYFRLSIHKLRIGDKLIVRSEDGRKYGELLIRTIEQRLGVVQVSEIVWREFDEVSHDEIGRQGFKVEFAGLNDQWRVVRTDDGKVMKGGLASKEAAEAYVRTDMNVAFTRHRA